MESKGYLIDTNIAIDYLENNLQVEGLLFLDSIINKVPIISVITQIELLSFKAEIEYGLLLNNFVNDSILIDLSKEIINETILIRKNYSIKLPDAIIAATAKVFNYTLLTRNTKDFKNITNLKLENPFLK